MRVSRGLLPLDFGNLENGLSTTTANGNMFWGECEILQGRFYFFLILLTLIVSSAGTTLCSWACDKFWFFVLLFFFSFASSVRLFPFRISRQKITRQQQRACVQSLAEPGRF